MDDADRALLRARTMIDMVTENEPLKRDERRFVRWSELPTTARVFATRCVLENEYVDVRAVLLRAGRVRVTAAVCEDSFVSQLWDAGDGDGYGESLRPPEEWTLIDVTVRMEFEVVPSKGHEYIRKITDAYFAPAAHVDVRKDTNE